MSDKLVTAGALLARIAPEEMLSLSVQDGRALIELHRPQAWRDRTFISLSLVEDDRLVLWRDADGTAWCETVDRCRLPVRSQVSASVPPFAELDRDDLDPALCG